MTIRTKLLVLISLLIGAISLFLFLFFPMKLEEQAIRSIEDRGMSIAKMTAFSVSPGLYFDDKDAVDEALEGAKQNRDLAYIIVVDQSNRVFAVLNQSDVQIADVLQLQSGSQFSDERELLEIATPIHHNQRVIGRLILGVKLTNLQAEVAQSKTMVATISFVIFLCGLLAIWGISLVVTRPLSLMVQTVQHIASGDLSQRAKVQSRDEVSLLAKSFNVMVDRVEQDTLDLEKEIVERKQTEEALAESEHRLHGLVEHLPEGVCLLDAEFRLVLTNPIGKEYWQRLSTVNDAGVLSQVGDITIKDLLAASDESQSREISIDNGTRRVFEIELCPVVVGSAEEGWVLVIREVTREREAQEFIQQQNRLASIGQLAAGVAHDFNNLLTGIIGQADVLKIRKDVPESIKNELANISLQGERAAVLIRQILDFSRKRIADREPMAMLPFIKEEIKLLQRTLPENIQIIMEIGSGEFAINGNITQLQQIMTNLAVNARDAIEKDGELRIGLASLRVGIGDVPPVKGLAPGKWVVWTFSDTGKGMPPDVIARIYEPFYTTKPSGEGTGLGLAQVYGIIKQHEGHISVESTPEEGTTFSIYFPEVEEPIATVGSEETAGDLIEGLGQTILIVDDEPLVRTIVTSILEEMNYRSSGIKSEKMSAVFA